MSHPQLNTAQIHVMVQSITALHEEALASADKSAPSDTASPDTEPSPPPTLILTSRAPGSAPLPPSVDPIAEDDLDEAAAPHSAEIIDIMERIEALAAATDALPKEDEWLNSPHRRADGRGRNSANARSNRIRSDRIRRGDF